MGIKYDNIPVELALHSTQDCQRVISEYIIGFENDIIENKELSRGEAVRETTRQLLSMFTNGHDAVPRMIITPDQDRTAKIWAEAVTATELKNHGVRASLYGIWAATNIGPGLLDTLETTRGRLLCSAIKD